MTIYGEPGEGKQAFTVILAMPEESFVFPVWATEKSDADSTAWGALISFVLCDTPTTGDEAADLACCEQVFDDLANEGWQTVAIFSGHHERL
jgi:hypothetical protein